MFIGIDIGGTKTAVLLTDQHLNSLCQTLHPTTGSTLVSDLKRAITSILDLANCAPTLLQGIGIGIPGMVDPARGEVSLAVNLQIKRPLTLIKQLKTEFPIPIALENDVRLATLGIQKKLGVDTVAYLNLGTGVSAGVVINGRVHRGVTGMAGEIGHMPINSASKTLESLISGPSIVQQAQAAGLTVKHAGELYHLAVQENAQAKAIIQQVSFNVSQAILWLIMTYDVERLILGGGVTSIGAPFLNPIIAELNQMKECSSLARHLVSNTKIELSPSDFNAGLWGAIHLARQAATEGGDYTSFDSNPIKCSQTGNVG